MTDTMPTHLTVKWSISRGRETYGYNICRLIDRSTGKSYRAIGGGYDMLGTVFGDWLQDAYAGELLTISGRADHFWAGLTATAGVRQDRLYGLTCNSTIPSETRVYLSGSCGLESMKRIAEAIGLTVQQSVNRKGNVTDFIASRAS